MRKATGLPRLLDSGTQWLWSSTKGLDITRLALYKGVPYLDYGAIASMAAFTVMMCLDTRPLSQCQGYPDYSM